ncbi:hypothetical protein VN97_g8748 [Penicillium thymicola]|uniref:Uncharacterized protein n=1 Tax=Penicillium thymicola TaxID=293382 RepID=A0AAI9TCX0_PENTH|nr:hypothetical protein VN97_g8748 [Penicillium thymicola]
MFKPVVALGHESILQILDAAGTVRYQGRFMKAEEVALFDGIIKLVNDRKFHEAELDAKSAIEGGNFTRSYMPWPTEEEEAEEEAEEE